MNKQFLLLAAFLVFGFKIECAAPICPVVIVNIDSDTLPKLATQRQRKDFFSALQASHPKSSFLLASCSEDNTPEYQCFCRIVAFIDLERDIALCRSASDFIFEIGHFQAIIRPNGVVNVGFSIAVTSEEYKKFLEILANKVNFLLCTSSKKGPDLIDRAASTPSAFRPFKK